MHSFIFHTAQISTILCILDLYYRDFATLFNVIDFTSKEKESQVSFIHARVQTIFDEGKWTNGLPYVEYTYFAHCITYKSKIHVNTQLVYERSETHL